MSWNSDEDSIRDFFKSCGSIKQVRMGVHPDGKSKGFCHVEFSDEKGSGLALKRNNESLDGRNIKVDEAAGRRRDD